MLCCPPHQTIQFTANKNFINFVHGNLNLYAGHFCRMLRCGVFKSIQYFPAKYFELRHIDWSFFFFFFTLFFGSCFFFFKLARQPIPATKILIAIQSHFCTERFKTLKFGVLTSYQSADAALSDNQWTAPASHRPPFPSREVCQLPMPPRWLNKSSSLKQK